MSDAHVAALGTCLHAARGRLLLTDAVSGVATTWDIDSCNTASSSITFVIQHVLPSPHYCFSLSLPLLLLGIYPRCLEYHGGASCGHERLLCFLFLLFYFWEILGSVTCSGGKHLWGRRFVEVASGSLESSSSSGMIADESTTLFFEQYFCNSCQHRLNEKRFLGDDIPGCCRLVPWTALPCLENCPAMLSSPCACVRVDNRPVSQLQSRRVRLLHLWVRCCE